MKKVFCKKHQTELEALKYAPFPGAKGEEILNTISQKAWDEWVNLQTMLINEKQLNAFDVSSREYLAKQRDKFFNNEECDKAEGFVGE